MSETPIYDQLITERLGRGPAQFEGHDGWEESEEAAQAFARGVAEAEATRATFWKPNSPGASSKPRRRQKAAVG